MNWQLWRQDDNGQRFLAGTCFTGEEAETRMAELMQGHHNQTYWICNKADSATPEN